jgi:hypothetical protein
MLSTLGLLALVSLTPDSTRLSGTVTSTYDGLPLENVRVALPGVRRFVVTDSLGAFAFDSLPSGHHRIRLEYLGRTNGEHGVWLNAGKPTQLVVLLDMGAADLAPVVAKAERQVDLWGLAGFYYRRAIGWGHFFTPADIAERDPEEISDLLRGVGVGWGCVRNGCGPETIALGRRCLMLVRIDGFWVWPEDLNTIRPEDVGGVEVYHQSWSVPSEFADLPLTGTEQRTARLTGGSSLTLPQELALTRCGTILIWTKDFRSRFEL